MSSENLKDEVSWAQTVGASLTSVLLFFLLFYFVAPILDNLLGLLGWFVVPESYRSGADTDILSVAFRSVMASALSAYAAFMVSSVLFRNVHIKTAVAVFALAVAAWGGAFVYLGFAVNAVGIPVRVVLLGAAPALFVAYVVWHGGLRRGC